MNSLLLTWIAIINAPPSISVIKLRFPGIIGSSAVRFVSDFCMFWRRRRILRLFSYAEARRGADYIPGISKYHAKVTFPSVICATSKSNYMENDVRKAVCVFSLSKQRFQRSFYTCGLWDDKQAEHTRVKSAVYILAYLEKAVKSNEWTAAWRQSGHLARRGTKRKLRFSRHLFEIILIPVQISSPRHRRGRFTKLLPPLSGELRRLLPDGHHTSQTPREWAEPVRWAGPCTDGFFSPSNYSLDWTNAKFI